MGLISLLMVSSCKNYYLHKYCKSGTNVKDSTVIKITIRDSVNITQRDSVVITKGGSVETDFNPCDSITGKLKELSMKFKNGGNTTTIKTENGKLVVKTDCEDQINHYKLLAEYYKGEWDTALMIQYTEIKTVEKKLTWWEHFKVGHFGDASFVLSLVFICYIIYKIKF